jgi:hypothetical protein
MSITKDQNGMAAVDSTHPDYDTYLSDWMYIDKIMSGRNIKSEIHTLNPLDSSEGNQLRNAQYKDRAVFYRIAGRTANRMIGLVFSKWPTLRIPTELDYITQNIDGAGTSIYQQSQAALKSTVAKGRAGLLVEYPEVVGEVTRADMEDGKYYATVQRFEPQQIINWSIMRYGANMAIERVVIKDTVETYGGTVDIIRELKMEWRPLRDNMASEYVYVSREWRKSEDKNIGWYVNTETIPTDGFGKPWDEIPFAFIGSETNQPRIDEPPMLDICRGNVCHYRLHADYMDSCHYVGQPTGYVNGVEDIKGFTENQKADGWYAGSRKMAILPPGGVIAFASVPPNTMVKEAMDSAKEDLIGMGAFYITPGSAIKTATQAEAEQEEQHSVLSLATSNVAEAYSKALSWMARYMRVEIVGKHEDGDGKITDDTPVYDIRRDFIQAAADPQLISAMWKLVLEGGLPKSDFWQMLRKTEKIDPEKSDDEIREEIEADRGAGTDADLSKTLAMLDDEATQDEDYIASLERSHPELNETAGA